MAKSVRVAAKEAMQKFGYDPLEVMVLHAQDANTSTDVKLEIAGVLLPYMYPKLSSIAIEGELNTSATSDAQAELFRRVMSSPELADAAQKLSLAAAEAALSSDIGTDPTIM